MNKWVKFAVNIASAAIPGVAQIESIARALPGLKGKAKQDAVVELVKASILASESVADKDLLNDPEVEKSTRGIVDAVVAFQNVIAKTAKAA